MDARAVAKIILGASEFFIGAESAEVELADVVVCESAFLGSAEGRGGGMVRKGGERGGECDGNVR